MVNTFIGGLHLLTFKRRHATYTNNMEEAVAYHNLYTENNYNAFIEPDLFFYIISNKNTQLSHWNSNLATNTRRWNVADL